MHSYLKILKELNSRHKGGQQVEFIAPSRVNKFSYELVDGVLLTDRQNFQRNLNYFLNEGVEPRKIILWNNQGIPEIFTLRDKDGVDVAFMEGLQFHIRKQEDLNFLNQMREWLNQQKNFYAQNPSQYPKMVERQYRRPINWKNPKTFTEKIQWMKLYDSTPIKTRLAPKKSAQNI